MKITTILRPAGLAAVLLCLLSTSQPAGACSYIRAFLVAPTSCSFAEGDYITIGTVDEEPINGHDCEQETFHTRYNATKTDGCGGSTTCSFRIEGNNLSGTYQVDQVSNGCLNLCTCTPQ